MFKPEHIAIANKTSRNSSAIGGKAITPKAVLKHLEEHISYGFYKHNVTILDFGAGKSAAYTRALLDKGYDCTAYEFGSNINDSLHDINALDRQYEVVFASNVLNIQSSENMAQETIKQLAGAVKNSGILFANYPRSPRKTTLHPDDMEEILQEYFFVGRVGGSVQAPLWACRKIIVDSG